MTNKPILLSSIYSEIDNSVVLIQIFRISKRFTVRAEGMAERVFETLDLANEHAKNTSKLFYKPAVGHFVEVSTQKTQGPLNSGLRLETNNSVN